MDDPASFVSIADRLESAGFAIHPGFLSPPEVIALQEHALGRLAAGDFRPAAVGSGAGRRVRPDVRGDDILWLSSPECGAERRLLDRLEALRLTLNRELSLGLFELECHYAAYPPGAAYAKHLDRFVTDASRVVSCIVYLNPGWDAADGGALRLHVGDGTVDVLPEGGTLAVFLSERFWHEVLPATRLRLSLTGWFRQRA
jgi:SM-20-related protein